MYITESWVHRITISSLSSPHLLKYLSMDSGAIVDEGISIMVVYMLYGMYTLISFLSIYFLWHHPRAIWHPRKLLLSLISTMFIVHTGVMLEMSICFVNDLKDTFGKVNGRLNLQAQLVEAMLARINFFLSDVIVVWRAMSLSSHAPSYKSRYVLSACLFASFVVLSVDGGFTLTALLRQNAQERLFALSSIGTTPVEQLGLMRITLPIVLFVTNIIATGYIGLAWWSFRKATKDFSKHAQEVMNIGQTLLFMFESGFIYSIIWIIIIFDIVFTFPPKITIALDLIIPQITAIYPALIILLNAAQKSIYTQNKNKKGDGSCHPNHASASVPIQNQSVVGILTTQFQLDIINNTFTTDIMAVDEEIFRRTSIEKSPGLDESNSESV
ncbi:hypothetical protein D9757_007229 [Collybiopsis confluens]|uniref:Uncharacterized protein n=1 Tax=Collybiopsis confluens TaxID=2823264 RepID=A0A8H5HAD4_9AGAR|nr:hypothetical protein D9757_007229 [Collybiopsis confluens]